MFQLVFFDVTGHRGCLILQTWKYGPTFQLRRARILVSPRSTHIQVFIFLQDFGRERRKIGSVD